MSKEREKEDKICAMDVNIYATRKTVAQGMMDIALLTANASQLKHMISVADSHDYYALNLVLIGTSMILQVIVGILLVVLGRWNINDRKDQRSANSTNNLIVLLIFLITVVNVLITSFDDDYDRITGEWASSVRRDLKQRQLQGNVRIPSNHSEI